LSKTLLDNHYCNRTYNHYLTIATTTNISSLHHAVIGTSWDDGFCR
jgi:hypothetical protein